MKKLLQKFKKNKKGFTLIELIIVIAIIAILIGVLAPQYLKYVEKTRVSADLQTMDTVENAIKVAMADPNLDITLTANAKCKVTGATLTWTDAPDSLKNAVSDSLGDTPKLKSNYGKTTGMEITVDKDTGAVTESWEVGSDGKLKNKTTTTTTPAAGGSDS